MSRFYSSHVFQRFHLDYWCFCPHHSVGVLKTVSQRCVSFLTIDQATFCSERWSFLELMKHSYHLFPTLRKRISNSAFSLSSVLDMVDMVVTCWKHTQLAFFLGVFGKQHHAKSTCNSALLFSNSNCASRSSWRDAMLAWFWVSSGPLGARNPWNYCDPWPLATDSMEKTICSALLWVDSILHTSSRGFIWTTDASAPTIV